MARSAFIIAGVRTPIGKAPKGSLRLVRPDDLLSHTIRSLLDRFNGFDAVHIQDVIIGCATPEAEQGLNVARIASLRAGIPVTTPAFTLNRFCASGLEAIALAASRILTGTADVVLAGGVESMSRLPMGGWHPAPNPALMETYPDAYLSMGLTAENLAQKFKISRYDQDQFALTSHRKATDAIESGRFAEETIPVPIRTTRWDEKGRPESYPWMLERDECPRPDTSLEILSNLKPVFKQDGSVTAGNSSPMSDGAAAVLLASPKAIRKFGWEPVLEFKNYAVVGVEPEYMGIGPVEALKLLTKRTRIRLEDVDIVELNEAFAAQVLAVLRHFHDLDPSRLNPNGGAIALGHPLGCTGARQTVTLMHEMRRRKARYGIVTMCVGGGMGAAALFEGIGT